MTIWSISADAPVAKLECGPWGDSYPAIRLTEGGGAAEAYTEQANYGEVPEAQAKVNLALATASPDLFAACNSAFEFLGGVDDAVEVRDVLLKAILRVTHPSQGIEARQGQDAKRLDRNDESPVGGNADAPTTPINQGEAEILRAHIADQIKHVENRIQDGKEMGATVWRIALEDIVRENTAVLASLSARSTAE